MADDPATGELPAVERRGHGHGMYDEEHNPRARASDKGWRYKLGWVYRNTLPLVCLAIAFWALGRTQSDVERQREGRAVAIDVLCGFGNGVAEAGRKALAGELVGQQPGRGLSKASQSDYIQTITSTLLAEAGIQGRDVIRPDGEVDCARL